MPWLRCFSAGRGIRPGGKGAGIWISVSDEDVEKEYADMAEQYKMEADKIKAAVPADAIKNDLKIEKALDLVRDSAKIEEVTE